MSAAIVERVVAHKWKKELKNLHDHLGFFSAVSKNTVKGPTAHNSYP